mmetsp:Transcript_8895/g.16680  ORF Transcript_8895/g.16680 Transcript_8895/m.16680 type:complete len:467 (+) Transcript_8895:3533-4933(+)
MLLLLVICSRMLFFTLSVDRNLSSLPGLLHLSSIGVGLSSSAALHVGEVSIATLFRVMNTTLKGIRISGCSVPEEVRILKALSALQLGLPGASQHLSGHSFVNLSTLRVDAVVTSALMKSASAISKSHRAHSGALERNCYVENLELSANAVHVSASMDSSCRFTHSKRETSVRLSLLRRIHCIFERALRFVCHVFFDHVRFSLGNPQLRLLHRPGEAACGRPSVVVAKVLKGVLIGYVREFCVNIISPNQLISTVYQFSNSMCRQLIRTCTQVLRVSTRMISWTMTWPFSFVDVNASSPQSLDRNITEQRILSTLSSEIYSPSHSSRNRSVFLCLKDSSPCFICISPLKIVIGLCDMDFTLTGPIRHILMSTVRHISMSPAFSSATRVTVDLTLAIDGTDDCDQETATALSALESALLPSSSANECGECRIVLEGDSSTEFCFEISKGKYDKLCKYLIDHDLNFLL